MRDKAELPRGGDFRKTYRGHVKWFNPTKGFGFVVTEDPGPDILVHVNVLRNFGRSSISEGSTVELVAQRTDRGLQATRILSIHPPRENGFGSPEDTRRTEEDQGIKETSAYRPARVKWFDKQRGFGFVNVFGSTQDIFIHMEILRNSGLAILQPGEAVSVQISRGPRGQLVSDVQPWDFGEGLEGIGQSDDADLS